MSDIYLGNTEIEKAYIGNTLIYEKGGGDSGGGDSGSGEMNCVYKEITAAGIKFNIMPQMVVAPIKNNIVVVHAKNTSASYSYDLQISQSDGGNGRWYYQFSIPANGDVLIFCDPNTEIATLYSKSNKTSTIEYFNSGSGGGGSD